MCECIIVRYPAIDGVRTEANEIEYCPLHAAAPQLLEACELVEETWGTPSQVSPLTWNKIKAAIQAAKGE